MDLRLDSNNCDTWKWSGHTTAHSGNIDYKFFSQLHHSWAIQLDPVEGSGGKQPNGAGGPCRTWRGWTSRNSRKFRASCNWTRVFQLLQVPAVLQFVSVGLRYCFPGYFDHLVCRRSCAFSWWVRRPPRALGWWRRHPRPLPPRRWLRAALSSSLCWWCGRQNLLGSRHERKGNPFCFFLFTSASFQDIFFLVFIQILHGNHFVSHFQESKMNPCH